jgi:molecular chaperone DnaK (HSP70)
VIGTPYSDELVKELRENYYMFNDVRPDVRGNTAFYVEIDEENSGIYSSEEIISQILKHVKTLSEIQAGSEIQDVVLTVPQGWDMNKKQMLVDSAELVDLRVVSMITENIGSAISYGVDRLDEKDHFVLFINLGATDLELTLFRFYTTEKSGKKVENIEILLEDQERDVGGFMFDRALVEILVDRFNALPKRAGKEDIRGNAKIMSRMFREIGKKKEVLSSNKEVFIKMAELDGQINLETTVTKEQFEKAI